MTSAYTSAYAEALATLHRAPLDAFVTERKRLAAELAGAGDRAGAAQLAKLPRPTVAAWVVNQLFWRERCAFERLLATAEHLRQGQVDAAATGAHREAIADLRVRAARVLTGAGKQATEATLHRVTVTLSVLAAVGGFQPDPAGALQREREPLGFDVPGLRPPAATARSPAAAPAPPEDATLVRARETEAAAERGRVERERARRTAERQRLSRELRRAQEELAADSATMARLEQALARAGATLARSRAAVNDLEARLAGLGGGDAAS